MKLFALQNNKLPTLPSGMKGKKQGHVYSHLFNENLPHAHTALFDTCSLARILVKLFDYDIHALINVMNLVADDQEISFCSCTKGCGNQSCGCRRKKLACTLLCKNCHQNCLNGNLSTSIAVPKPLIFNEMEMTHNMKNMETVSKVCIWIWTWIWK